MHMVRSNSVTQDRLVSNLVNVSLVEQKRWISGLFYLKGCFIQIFLIVNYVQGKLHIILRGESVLCTFFISELFSLQIRYKSRTVLKYNEWG